MIRIFCLIFIMATVVIACNSANDSTHTETKTDSGDKDADAEDTDSGDTDAEDTDSGDTDSGDTDAGDDDALPMDCSDCPNVGSDLEHMLCAFDICEETILLSSEISSTSSIDDLNPAYEAVKHFGSVSNDLAPRKNGSYAMIGTGIVEGKTHSMQLDNGDELLTDPWVDQSTHIRDIVEWKMLLKAPPNAEAIRFKYVFFSEEYDDYIGTSWNDKFYVILESASTNGGAPTIINYTECRDEEKYFDFDTSDGCDLDAGYCCYIAINTSLSDCCWFNECPDSNIIDNTDISGTGYECSPDEMHDNHETGSSTGWLQTSWPITAGETFAITFHIHDTKDWRYESQVILDSFEFLGTEAQGTEPF